MMIGARSGVKRVRLVVVGKNPGEPVKGSSEAIQYRNALKGATLTDRKERLFNAMIALGESYHLDPLKAKNELRQSGRYHENLMNFLKKLLAPKASGYEEVLDQVYFTEALKCSTPKECGYGESMSLFSPKVRCKTKKCAPTLAKELAVFPNLKAVVALGLDSYAALSMYSDHEVFYLRHPSWFKENPEAEVKLRKLLTRKSTSKHKKARIIREGSRAQYYGV